MNEPLESIYDAIEFFEDHLYENVTVAQTADFIGYSLFHFIRMFNRIAHHTPYDYLIRRRLSESARILTNSHRRITDIAQDFCFQNQESYSRAFKRMFDMQPSQWREEAPSEEFALMPKITLADLAFRNSDFFRSPELFIWSETRYQGLMTKIIEDKNGLQEWKNSLAADLKNCLSDGSASPQVTITFSVNSDWRNRYEFIGIEKPKNQRQTLNLVERIVPAGNYAGIFYPVDFFKEARTYLFFTWFPAVCCRATCQEFFLLSFSVSSFQGRQLFVPVVISEKSNIRLKDSRAAI